jgi:hypothetical protein
LSENNVIFLTPPPHKRRLSAAFESISVVDVHSNHVKIILINGNGNGRIERDNVGNDGVVIIVICKSDGRDGSGGGGGGSICVCSSVGTLVSQNAQ